MELFKDIPNITFDKDADIEIVNLGIGNWKILEGNKVLEYWTTFNPLYTPPGVSFSDPPIYYLTQDKELLPYCMKDRLAYLQDKINKEKGKYK